MRCLISLIAITLIFIASVFEVIRNANYSFLYNFALVPVAIAALFLRRMEALILMVLSCLLALSFILIGASSMAVIQTASLLLICGVLIYYFKIITEGAIVQKANTLESEKATHRLAYEQNETAQNSKKHLEKAVYDISSLYRAPKKMADSTTLQELTDTLMQTVNEYFTFSRCKIVIFSFKDDEPKIETVYNIPEAKEANANKSAYEEQLIDVIGAKKKSLIIDRAAGILPPDGLTLPDDLETFLAVPLAAGDRYNGIFVVEGFVLDDLVRLMILSNQFSMVLERIRLYELVHELAITDGLTAAFVRRHFLKRFAEEIERAKYYDTRISFIMIDIDHFKKCNDKYGHLVGDVVLRDVASTLKESLRDIDIIGRYGGEEFSIMLPETHKEGAAIVCERLRKAVEVTEIKAYDEKIRTTISLGLSTFPDDSDELSQLIDKADQMLYKAKKEGRNRVRIYGKE